MKIYTDCIISELDDDKTFVERKCKIVSWDGTYLTLEIDELDGPFVTSKINVYTRTDEGSYMGGVSVEDIKKILNEQKLDKRSETIKKVLNG